MFLWPIKWPSLSVFICRKHHVNIRFRFREINENLSVFRHFSGGVFSKNRQHDPLFFWWIGVLFVMGNNFVIGTWGEKSLIFNLEHVFFRGWVGGRSEHHQLPAPWPSIAFQLVHKRYLQLSSFYLGDSIIMGHAVLYYITSMCCHLLTYVTNIRWEIQDIS